MLHIPPNQSILCNYSNDFGMAHRISLRLTLVKACCCCCVASVVSDSVRPHRWQPPGSPVPGILQARTLEWVAISFSNAWKWKNRVKSLSCLTPSDPMDCSPPGPSVHGIFQARVLEWVAIAFSENGYLYMYGWAPLRLTRNDHNIVNQLYSNTK